VWDLWPTSGGVGLLLLLAVDLQFLQQLRPHVGGQVGTIWHFACIFQLSFCMRL